MTTIDPQAAAKMQPELMSGESFYWAGMPNPTIIFHSDDWSTVPFSVFWCGFTFFWEGGALGYWGNNGGRGASVFMGIWGVPFILIGQYLLWGRFVFDGWLKRRTYYAVTNRRVLIVQDGWKRKASSMYLEAIPTINREGTVTGTLWFGPKYPVLAGRGQKIRDMSRFAVNTEVPVFADIDDVDSVYRVIMELRENLRKETNFGVSPALA